MQILRWIRLPACLGLLLCSTVGHAFDYGQGRGLGGAGVAAIADHSAIVQNPAGITMLPRYSVGSVFYHQKNAAAFGFSVLDNKTSPIAMGVDYRNIRPIKGLASDFGRLIGHRLNVALGEYYEGKVHIGFGYEFRRDVFPPPNPTTTPTKANGHNIYTGMIVPINDIVQFGFSTYDILWFTKNATDTSFRSGISLMPHEKILLAIDVVQITDSIKHWQAALGAQVAVLEAFALRAGWTQDYYEPGRPMTWSAGLGWYFPKGQIAYSFNTEPQKRQRHTISIEVDVR